ncbi:MAG TPA: 30S ribosomal protein S4 [Nitrososphaeraceae archaeon]|jgi:small subunit ribosomal protein S4|nr:30S ribosomal protein S4 [Nitrososphaeraceae archaeon]HEU5172482.1 30S ribosomal protein S4 [Nitrososphaeraceae archaeon]
MGDPKKSRKTFRRPRQIWTTEQLSSELYLIGSYGLRSKSELWKAQTKVADIRNQARELLALTVEARQVQETKLLNYLHKLGLVKESATLDDVLNLKLEDILERRLQTIIMKKGVSKSPQQSRQLVVHGHVSIGERVINIPGYMVRKDEEPTIVLHDEFITQLQNPPPSQ